MSKNSEHTIEQLSSSQRLLLSLKEARTKIEALERQKTEPIAIVGMGCRFPGGVTDSESYWRLLCNGVDAVTEIPEDRWDVDAYYDPDPNTPGKMYTRYGSFLEEVDKFDPVFFGISPREAENIDPQQRLLLEVSWEALEHAGIAPERLKGSQTGIFIGSCFDDYSRFSIHSGDPSRIDAYNSLGSARSIAAGRLSYLLDLQGPSIQLDTACSSSVLTVHLACQSLRSRECHLALAGGVNLMLSPEVMVGLCQLKALSMDGHCKTFDATADGYVRGEGCGVVVLKRLSDAIADGDNILALIRGSAVNHDGRSNGLTAPNGLAQEALLCQALSNAKVNPSQIQYVEAHGTGTSLGDPIEVLALGKVLGKGRSSQEPLFIGSVKTNIGHLEGAAGIASLIKVVLALQHQQIPPHLHLKKPNSYIPWEKLPIVVPHELTPWTAKAGPRLAGVSSFGMSGTNVHLVVEETPILDTEQFNQQLPVSDRSTHLLTLSATHEDALRDLVRKYLEFLNNHPTVSIADICWTANTGRSHFEHRLAILTPSVTKLQDYLTAFSASQSNPNWIKGRVDTAQRLQVAFLFTGQGSQWVNMGRQLYEEAPVFRETLEYCDAVLRPYLENPLLEILYPVEESKGQSARKDLRSVPILNCLDETAYTQPALFALEYALFQLWQSLGVTPKVVMGHSVGEYAAACAAGVFSLEDGLKLISARGRLMQALPQDGEMVVVFASEVQVAIAIQPYQSEVAIAAVNGSKNTVISGKRKAITKVVATLKAKGVKTKSLKVSHAFHSPLMEPMLAAFEQIAREVHYSSPRIGLISNLTGNLISNEIATPEYWINHVRLPVQFAASMETLHKQGYDVFVECGPKPVLLGMGRNCLGEQENLWLPSLYQGRSDWQQILESLAELYVRGMQINWAGFDQYHSRQRITLPTYPFQRQHYWIKATEKNRQPAEAFEAQQQAQTLLTNLLNQGNTEQLAQLLEKQKSFSQDEIKLLPKVVEALVRQHHQQQTASSIKDCLYQLAWQPKPRQANLAGKTELTFEPGTWIVLADQGGVGQALATLLEKQGQCCFVVHPGNLYKADDTRHRVINPANHSDFERLFEEVLKTSELPLRGVVHLWSLEIAAPDELTIASLEQAQMGGCGSVLHLVQTLIRHSQSIAPRLWLVSQGAVPIGNHSVAVAQVPLWGMGKAIALEHPELWGGMLDLPLDATPDVAATILTEIWDSLGEDHLAFREGQRYVARLTPSQPPQSQGIRLRDDATYLITGGLGALGLKVAQWMVQQGARHLVLTGRNQASDQALNIINSIEQGGCKVLVAQADVSDWEDMVRVFEEIKAGPPLQGIIHAAGLSAYQSIEDMDLDTFESMLRPKVIGTWILHQLTRELTLDFFVLFSSIASIWSSKGQAHYAAANSFLDGLAHYRRTLGLPATSINWGPWAGGGMATAEFQTMLTRMGIEGLQPEIALAALGYLLGADCVQATVAKVNWSLFKGLYEARGKRALLDQIEILSKEAVQPQPPQRSEVVQQLEAAPISRRQHVLMTYLQSEVAKVLKLEQSQYPDLQRGFFDMGMDSLMAVELKQSLEADLGSPLPATLAFDCPNIASLADYLATKVLGWKPVSQDASEFAPEKDKQSIAALEVEQLPEDVVQASIAMKLAELETLLVMN
jgi:acyl transferase domain-containing protein/acyl carrier protein